jgi:hypothetical protein
MKDYWLVVIGAVLGAVLALGVKAFVEPLLNRRDRQATRRESGLERAIQHVDRVLLHNQAVRSENTAALRFDGDSIARAILRTLTPEFGPGALKPVDGQPYSATLSADLEAASEAWMAVRLAIMDDQHDAQAAEEKYEPMYALQWYETSLLNFASDARRQLSA